MKKTNEFNSRKKAEKAEKAEKNIIYKDDLKNYYINKVYNG
jgi:hypothetical protein